jgi:hypothetical protein
MSSGGGKGGKKTQETTIPSWIRDPAIRNLQRAEAVQQLPYMPYYGADVAAFTPTQNAAFNANIGAGEAFGLLAPNTLTATSGMPTPTEFAGGFKGYSSQGLYDQALAELKAKQPKAVAQYDALFGNTVPAPNYGGGGGGRFRGSAGGNPQRRPNDWNPTMGVSQAEYEKAMDKKYAEVRTGTGEYDYGYTGQDAQSRAGTRNKDYYFVPKTNVQKAQDVDLLYGKRSPIRWSGDKKKFGL